MRYFFQDIFRDGTAAVVPSGTVTVYQAGSTTPAKLYAASAGGTSTAFVTTDVNGYFNFWVDDGDYIGKYKLVLSKTNYITTSYDSVSIQTVDLNSAQALANKTITSPTITGTVVGSATYTTPTITSPVLNTGVSGTAVLNDPTMAGNSNTQIPTQSSVRGFVLGDSNAMVYAWIFGA